MAEDFLQELDEELAEDDFTEIESGLSEVETSNTIHDQLQFQSTFDFDLQSHEDEVQKRYQVDTYFFFPKSMGINSTNFTREQFYASLTNYIRIRTPAQLQQNQPFNQDWSIPVVDQYFSVHLLTHLREELGPLVEQEIKLFGCQMNTRLKKWDSHIKKGIRKRNPKLNLLKKELESFVRRLTTYRRRYMGRVKYQPYLLDPEIKMAFLLVDEYISYRVESVLIKAYQRLEEWETKSETLMNYISWVLSSEMEYRQSENLLQLTEETPEAVRESYYYRLGLLKKYVSDVLYLQIRNKHKDKAYRNLVAAAGAALAAFWAGLIDLQRFYYLQQNITNVQGDFALRFFAIVIIGVIAYIFKDRIKELSREYFYARLKQYLPDFEFQMHYAYCDTTHKNPLDLEVGRSKEYMRFLKKEDLPPEISYIREVGHREMLDPERQEDIIHYAKQITFDVAKIQEHLSHLRFAKDIVRFSVAELLEKLDNPNKSLRYFDHQQGISIIKAPKVYHLNLLFRYAVSHKLTSGGWLPQRIEFERIRVVLDKDGIVRIETVLPRGAFGYFEENL